MCFTESSGERGRRLSGVERSGVSDNAATNGGGGGVRARTTLAEASVGGAIGRRCCVANGPVV